jgi:hypothetical protein
MLTLRKRRFTPNTDSQSRLPFQLHCSLAAPNRYAAWSIVDQRSQRSALLPLLRLSRQSLFTASNSALRSMLLILSSKSRPLLGTALAGITTAESLDNRRTQLTSIAVPLLASWNL